MRRLFGGYTPTTCLSRDEVCCMDSRPLFLDTNIYMGYALMEFLEDYHPECCQLIDSSPNMRHTSSTVKQELGDKIRNRNRLYREIFNHVSGGKPIETFRPSSSKKSDVNHYHKLADGYKKGLFDLEYIRGLGRVLKAGIDAGLKKTDPVLIQPSQDAQMKDSFRLMDIHRPDDSILADFIDWAFPGSGACFITGDGDINDKKGKIMDYVKNARGDCGHLSIFLIEEAAQRFIERNT